MKSNKSSGFTFWTYATSNISCYQFTQFYIYLHSQQCTHMHACAHLRINSKRKRNNFQSWWFVAFPLFFAAVVVVPSKWIKTNKKMERERKGRGKGSDRKRRESSERTILMGQNESEHGGARFKAIFFSASCCCCCSSCCWWYGCTHYTIRANVSVSLVLPLCVYVSVLSMPYALHTDMCVHRHLNWVESSRAVPAGEYNIHK